MFQFAKFEKSKERRLATELGYGFPIGDPWITDALSPHGLSPLKASFLLNARASIQCINWNKNIDIYIYDIEVLVNL